MRSLTKPTYSNQLYILSLWIGLLFVANACSPLIALHDPVSYRTALDLKVDFKFLVEATEEQYDSKEADVIKFRKAFEKSMAYEEGRYRNELTVEQYQIMADIIKRFVDTWKENGTISEFTRPAFLKQSQAAWDEIIKLERAKRTEGIKLKIDKTAATSAQTNI